MARLTNINRRDFLKVAGGGSVAAAALLAGCGSTPSSTSSSSSSSTGPVTLTMWQWNLGVPKAAALYHQLHPNITINVLNPGGGSSIYTKFTTAVKAGTGAPDLIMLEYQVLPQYIDMNALADISSYGAASLQNTFPAWAWKQSTDGSKVYAIPQDTGPLVFYYRSDVFTKLGLQPPKTWQDYADAAAKIHAADPSMYIDSFDPSDAARFNGLAWQAGANFFQKNGDTWTVSITNPQAKQVMQYWVDLYQKHLVKAEADFSNDVNADLDQSHLVGTISAVWYQNNFQTANTNGKWRVAPLPQWNANGPFTSAAWGGSTTAVTAQSQHKQEAAAFATWLNTNPDAYKLLIQQGSYPAATSLLTLPTLNGANSGFAGQETGPIYAASSQAINTNFSWGPQTTFFYSTLAENLTKAVQGQASVDQALSNTQSQVVTFLKAQGYNING
jgi:multiple sugar transport system substrate-binding protein